MLEAPPSVLIAAERTAVVKEVLEAVTETVGGLMVGVTELELAEAELVPTEFTAYIWKVYGVPSVRPETTMGEADEVAVMLPGVDEAR